VNFVGYYSTVRQHCGREFAAKAKVKVCLLQAQQGQGLTSLKAV